MKAARASDLTGKARKLLAVGRRSSFRRALLRHRVAAGTEHDGVGFSQRFNTVLDVGANRGQFALFALECFQPVLIVCIEPLPAAADRLRAVLNHAPAQVVQAAAGSEAGRLELHVPPDDDSSSALNPTERQVSRFPRTKPQETVAVPCMPLDEIVSARSLVRPTLLKIDVQGFELEVLRGAASTLDAVDQVYVECSMVELYAGQPGINTIIRHLDDRGFELVDVSNVTRDVDGSALQADFLFRRR